MNFTNAVPVLYYELRTSPERIREAFPLALEFKSPTSESFSIIQPPGKNAGLLVIDLKAGNRHIFVLPVKDKLILINETLPRVFVISPAGIYEFFKTLAENDLERLTDKGIGRKGKKWRFLIDFVATFIVVSIENQLHIGFLGVLILGAVFTTVEYLLGPRKTKFRTMVTELSEKSVRRMYEVLEKRGEVLEVSL